MLDAVVNSLVVTGNEVVIVIDDLHVDAQLPMAATRLASALRARQHQAAGQRPKVHVVAAYWSSEYRRLRDAMAALCGGVPEVQVSLDTTTVEFYVAMIRHCATAMKLGMEDEDCEALASECYRHNATVHALISGLKGSVGEPFFDATALADGSFLSYWRGRYNELLRQQQADQVAVLQIFALLHLSLRSHERFARDLFERWHKGTRARWEAALRLLEEEAWLIRCNGEWFVDDTQLLATGVTDVSSGVSPVLLDLMTWFALDWRHFGRETAGLLVTVVVKLQWMAGKGWDAGNAILRRVAESTGELGPAAAMLNTAPGSFWREDRSNFLEAARELVRVSKRPEITLRDVTVECVSRYPEEVGTLIEESVAPRGLISHSVIRDIRTRLEKNYGKEDAERLLKGLSVSEGDSTGEG
jgi:hypothetical protein